jgi:hypothetical protein
MAIFQKVGLSSEFYALGKTKVKAFGVFVVVSVPESTPTVPESTPTVPESTPKVPEATPTVPESTPTVPESTPTVPDSTPTVPESTPTVRESTPGTGICEAGGGGGSFGRALGVLADCGCHAGAGHLAHARGEVALPVPQSGRPCVAAVQPRSTSSPQLPCP